jgi:SAM-dependent methyltransferase
MEWMMAAILGGVAVLIPTAYAGKIGAPYAPTRLPAIRRAFDEVDINATDLVVDLGAGDGKVLREAARRGAHARGYELSPLLWAIAGFRIMGRRHTKVVYQNFYKASLRDATIIFAFLMPQNMERVKRFLARQRMPRGRFFVSYAFALPGIQPLQIVQTPKCARVYIYNLKDLTQPRT